jgi:hypothetical protein
LVYPAVHVLVWLFGVSFCKKCSIWLFVSKMTFALTLVNSCIIWLLSLCMEIVNHFLTCFSVSHLPYSVICICECLQHSKIIIMLMKYILVGDWGFRSADDLIFIFTSFTAINDIFSEFTNIHPKLIFALEHLMWNTLNLLCITECRNHVQFSIFRKPMTRDTVIM